MGGGQKLSGPTTKNIFFYVCLPLFFSYSYMTALTTSKQNGGRQIKKIADISLKSVETVLATYFLHFDCFP